MMAGLLGITDFERLSVHLIENEEGWDHFVSERPEWRKEQREYRRHGFPAGVANCRAEYGRHQVLIFLWQVRTMGQLADIVLHEMAHVATHKINLLVGPPQVVSYVAEQIIIPFLNAFYYDPELMLLMPRRMTDGNESFHNPDIPKREC